MDSTPDDAELRALCLDGLLCALMGTEDYSMEDMVAECTKAREVVQSKKADAPWNAAKAESRKLAPHALQAVMAKLKIKWLEARVKALKEAEESTSAQRQQLQEHLQKLSEAGKGGASATAPGAVGKRLVDVKTAPSKTKSPALVAATPPVKQNGVAEVAKVPAAAEKPAAVQKKTTAKEVVAEDDDEEESEDEEAPTSEKKAGKADDCPIL